MKSSIHTCPEPLGPEEPESPERGQFSVRGRRPGPQTIHPHIETPPLINNEPRSKGPPTPAPALVPRPRPRPQAPEPDRVVGGVPGDVLDALQLPLEWLVGGDAPERVLAQVPSPLDNLQVQGQVPLLVEEDLVAQEGEVDLPDLRKQLEGPEGREVELASEVRPNPGKILPARGP